MADPDWIGNPPEDPYWSDDGRSIYYERQRERGSASRRRTSPRRRLAGGYRRHRRGGPHRSRRARQGGRARRAQPPADPQGLRTRGTSSSRTSRPATRGRSRARRRTRESRTSWPTAGASGSAAATTSWSTTSSPASLSQPAELKLDKDPGRQEAHDLPAGAADPPLRRHPPEAGEGEARARGGAGAAAGRSHPGAAPLVPGQGGEDRDPLPLPFRRLARGGHLPEAGRERVQAVEDAAVRHRERQRRDPRRAPQGRRRGPVPHSVLLLDLRNHERHDLDWAVLPGSQGGSPEGAARGRGGPQGRHEGGGREEEDAGRGAAAKPRRQKTAERPRRSGGETKEPAPRPLEVAALVWSDDGRQLALELRARDNKDRWIATVDFGARHASPRHRLTDPAWINWNFNEFGWLRGQPHALVPVRGKRLLAALHAADRRQARPPLTPGQIRSLRAGAVAGRPLALLHGERRSAGQVRRLARRRSAAASARAAHRARAAAARVRAVAGRQPDR